MHTQHNTFQAALTEHLFVLQRTVFDEDGTQTAYYSGNYPVEANGRQFPITEVVVQYYSESNEILQIWAKHCGSRNMYGCIDAARAVGKLVNKTLVFTESDMQDTDCMNLEVHIS